MIDGVKIKVTNIDTEQALNNPDLMFIGTHATNTGEILNSPPIAELNGMNFRLVSQSENKSVLFINGSLHRFYRNGGKNNTDFYHSQLIESLNSISMLIKQPLQNCILENIEFGVNITTSTPAKHIIKSIVSNGSRKFAEMNVKKIGLGKVCGNQKSDYELKIYDKGRQAGTNRTNILRIEVKVKKMRFFKSYGINTLNSLLSKEKTGILGQILADLWKNIIYYDGSIDESRLNTTELLQLKDYQNPIFWENITHKSRYRERANFDSLVNKYSQTTEQTDIEKLILDKWKRLVNGKRKNVAISPDFLVDGKRQNVAISPFKCIVKTPQNPFQNDNKILPDFNTTEKRFCVNCGKEISYQKSDSKYCSQLCRNKQNNRIRQESIISQRAAEAENIKNVFRLVKKGGYPILITRTTATGITFEQTQTDKLNKLNYNELRKITAIEITVNDSKFVFTKINAKNLIQKITTKNKSK